MSRTVIGRRGASGAAASRTATAPRGAPSPGVLRVACPKGDNAGIVTVAGRRGQAGFRPECGAWAGKLEQADAEALLAAVRVLRDQGPAPGRPLADTVEGEPPRHHGGAAARVNGEN